MSGGIGGTFGCSASSAIPPVPVTISVSSVPPPGLEPGTCLPAASPQNPACGACSGETDYDDGFHCQDCQLAFNEETLEASFLDPDAPVCGAACDNYWHGDHKLKPGSGFVCGTCQLPAGHDSLHWTGCRPAQC